MKRFYDEVIPGASDDALIEEFLQVREEQLTAIKCPRLERWNKLEIRARELLQGLNKKGREQPLSHPLPHFF